LVSGTIYIEVPKTLKINGNEFKRVNVLNHNANPKRPYIDLDTYEDRKTKDKHREIPTADLYVLFSGNDDMKSIALAKPGLAAVMRKKCIDL
jgi:hypothetical protein